MSPRSTLTGTWAAKRRWRVAASRAALSVACLLALALAARADESAAPAHAQAPGEKDVRRAEKVLARLGLLDEAATRGDARALRDAASKLYPGLFVTVSELRPSDLKTDLDTAAFLYEEAARVWHANGGSPADCARERRDIYHALCVDLPGGTRAQLLVSKARLHARWAEAAVKQFRGEADAETPRLLSAMREARADDLRIAARALESLKALEPLVGAINQEGRGAASGVRPDRADGQFADALRRAGALIASLPRGPAFYDLSNAWRGYKDGLFWHRKVRETKKLVVSANGFAGDPLKDLRLDAAQVSGTAVANWEAAARYTRRAEQTLAGGLR